MTGSLIVQLLFFLCVVAPIVSLFLAFSDSEGTRQLARFILMLAWLGYGGVTAWCLWTSFFASSAGAGMGNGVFLLIAMPVGLFTCILFSVWRSSLRREHGHSLYP